MTTVTALALWTLAATAAAAPPGKPPIGGIRLLRVPATLGPAAVSADGGRLVAAVESSPELVVVALDSGRIAARVALTEPAFEVITHGGRILAAGKSGLTVLDAATLQPTAVEPPPLSEVRALAAPADPATGRPVVIGSLRDGARPGTFAVRLTGPTLRADGEPVELPRSLADDPTARYALSGDGRRLYVSHTGGTTVLDLDAGGRAVPADAENHGLVVGDRTGRYALGSDGSVLTADGLRTVARLAGGFVVPHPTRPLVVSFSVDQNSARPSLDDTGRYGTLHVYALPDFAKVSEWTAPGTLTGRRPILLPDGRCVFVARSVQPAGDPSAAMLLLSGGGLGGAGSGPDVGNAAGQLLKGALDWLTKPPAKPAADKPGADKPAPAGGNRTNSVRLDEITDRLFPGQTAPAEPAKAADPKAEAPSAVVRETFVIVASAGFDKLSLPPGVVFRRPPPAVAQPGAAYSATPEFRLTGPAAAPEFSRIAGPPGLTVDAGTGEIRFAPTIAHLGRHAVEIRARVAGGPEDRLAFDLEVRLPETPVRLPGVRGAAAPESAAVSDDGSALVCTDTARRTLYSFALGGAGPAGAPQASLTLDTRIDAVAAHYDRIAVATDGSPTVLLLNPRTLAAAGRITAVGLQPRFLLSIRGDALSDAAGLPAGAMQVPPMMVVSGPERDSPMWRTLVLDTDADRTVGETIPFGGRIALLPDGRTLVIGPAPGAGGTETVLFDLATRRVVETIVPGRPAGRYLPLPWAGVAGPAPRGGAALHPRLPIAVLWGEAAERAGAGPAAPPPDRLMGIRITGRRYHSAAPEPAARPFALTVVSSDSGRVLRTLELPALGAVTSVQFAAGGDELAVVAADRVVRLPLPADSLVPADVGLLFVSEPPAAASVGSLWRYRPVVLPESAGVRITVAAGPTGLRLDPLWGNVAWRPEPTDIGRHVVRLRATAPDGRSAEQPFTLEVRPASVAVADARGHWLTDAEGEVLVRRRDTKLEIHSPSDPAPRVVDLGEPVASAAARGGTVIAALPQTGRLVVVDLNSAQVVRRIPLDGARPLRVWCEGSEGSAVLVSDDSGRLRRLDPDDDAEPAVIGWGAWAVGSPDGSRIHAVAARESLPKEWLAELQKAHAPEEPPPAAPGARAGPRGGADIRTVGAVATTPRVRRDPRPAPAYLLTYVKTGQAVTLLDACPLTSAPEAMVVGDAGRLLYLLDGGEVSVRPCGDPSAAGRRLSAEGDPLVDLVGHAASGRALAIGRSGRLYWVDSGPAGVRLEPAALPGHADPDPAVRTRIEVRAAAAARTGSVWVVSGDRANRLPVASGAARAAGGSDALVFRSVPDLLYRAGDPFRYAPILSGDSPVRLSLTSAPAGMTLDETAATLVWTPRPGERGVFRVVIQARDRDGRTAVQAFLLRRGRSER